MKNKYFALVFIIIASLLFSSCKPAPATTQPPVVNPTEPGVVPTAPAGAMTLGVIYSQDDAILQQGVQTMATSLGITLNEAVSADAAAISSSIDTMVQAGVKGILIIHNATDDLKDAILKASQAGIKVVTVGDVPKPTMEGITSEVLLDDFDLGFVSLKAAFRALDYKGLLGVAGATGSKDLELRMRIVQLEEDLYANVRDVRFGTATDSQADIIAATKTALEKNPEIGAFWCSSTYFAKGVIAALTELGKTNIPVFAANGGLTSDDVNLMTASGSPLKSITYIDRSEAGKAGVRLVVSAILGDSIKRINFFLSNNITQDEAKALAAGVLPESQNSDIGWGDALMAKISESDPTLAAAAKQLLDDEFNSVLKPSKVVLPDPATLPADFKVKPLVIAGVHEQTNYQHNELLRSGMDEIAQLYKVQLLSSNANNDWSKMASDMENFIAQDVDAIVVDHGSTESMEPVIQKALDKGITVITFDCPTPDLEKVSSQIAQDDYGHAFLSLRPMISQIGGKGKIGVAWLGGYAPLENRMRVMRLMLELFPDIQTLEFGEDVDNYVDDAMAKTEALLGGNPDIVAFWATWDGLATGIDEALLQMKRTEIPLYTVDVSSEDIARMVQVGNPWVLTATSDPVEVGKVIMLTTIAAAYGQSTPKYIKIPAYFVTQAQAKQLEEGKLPTPPSSGEGWTPFMVGLRDLINQ